MGNEFIFYSQIHNTEIKEYYRNKLLFINHSPSQSSTPGQGTNY